MRQKAYTFIVNVPTIYEILNTAKAAAAPSRSQPSQRWTDDICLSVALSRHTMKKAIFHFYWTINTPHDRTAAWCIAFSSSRRNVHIWSLPYCKFCLNLTKYTDVLLVKLVKYVIMNNTYFWTWRTRKFSLPIYTIKNLKTNTSGCFNSRQ